MKVKYNGETGQNGNEWAIELPSGTIVAHGGNCLTFCGGKKRFTFPSGQEIDFPSWRPHVSFNPFSRFIHSKSDKTASIKKFFRPEYTENLIDLDYLLLLEFMYEKIKNEHKRQFIKYNNSPDTKPGCLPSCKNVYGDEACEHCDLFDLSH